MTPVVIKWHEKKALHVSKNYKNFIWVLCCMTKVTGIQSVTALKTKNWSGQEGVKVSGIEVVNEAPRNAVPGHG